MDFFEAVERRRSIRQFTKTPVPAEVIERALDAALLAPNSSNVQTWDFYWVRTLEKKTELVRLCLNQAAARTAQELLVVVADPAKWRRSHAPLVKFVDEVNAPRVVKAYYGKLIPVTYRWGFLNLIGAAKWAGLSLAGLLRPVMRGPATRGQLQEVALKSAALAAENFVLAITAQGFSTCMMEGFDEVRVRRLLGLSRSARIPMVISVGESSERGTWGPRFRLPREQVIHRV